MRTRTRRASHLQHPLVILRALLAISAPLILAACGVTTSAGAPASTATASASSTPSTPSTPSTLPPTPLPPTLTQHTAHLTVQLQSAGFATATCGPGEALVSGGSSSPNAASGPPFNLESYPSDAAGAAPTVPGQAEPGWTVRLLNRVTDQTVTATVSANCLVGGSTGIWFAPQPLALDISPGSRPLVSLLGAALPASAQPYPSLSGGELSFSLQCPATGDFTVLTGGGWKDFAPQPINEGVWEGAWPSAEQSVAHQTWNVSLGGNRTVEPVAYVVCARGLTARPIVSLRTSTPPLGLVTCPEPELLVGGGFREGFVDNASTTNALARSQRAWTAGGIYPLTLDVYGICVQVTGSP